MRKIAKSFGRFVTSVGASSDLQLSMVNIGSRTLLDSSVASAAQNDWCSLLCTRRMKRLDQQSEK